jgi:hypothetical protein
MIFVQVTAGVRDPVPSNKPTPAVDLMCTYTCSVVYSVAGGVSPGRKRLNAASGWALTAYNAEDTG